MIEKLKSTLNFSAKLRTIPKNNLKNQIMTKKLKELKELQNQAIKEAGIAQQKNQECGIDDVPSRDAFYKALKKISDVTNAITKESNSLDNKRKNN